MKRGGWCVADGDVAARTAPGPPRPDREPLPFTGASITLPVLLLGVVSILGGGCPGPASGCRFRLLPAGRRTPWQQTVSSPTAMHSRLPVVGVRWGRSGTLRTHCLG